MAEEITLTEAEDEAMEAAWERIAKEPLPPASRFLKLKKHKDIETHRDADQVAMSAEGNKWITIGGHEEEGKKHAGGFPVEIDSEGTILKGGPKSLHGKNVKDTKKHFDELRGEKNSEKSPQKSDNTVDLTAEGGKIKASG